MAEQPLARRPWRGALLRLGAILLLCGACTGVYALLQAFATAAAQRIGRDYLTAISQSDPADDLPSPF
jgi:hypothetical protein